MASDGYSQAVHFVEVYALYRTGLAVGKDHGLSDKLSLGSRELAEDRVELNDRDCPKIGNGLRTRRQRRPGRCRANVAMLRATT